MVRDDLLASYGRQGLMKQDNMRVLAGHTKEATIRYEKLFDDTELPSRATEGSAGYDLYAHLNDRTIKMHYREGEVVRAGPCLGMLNLRPGDKAIIPLGFKAALPAGFEAQIRPRSGASFKTGLNIPNSPGTIDPDYRGEWGVIVKNASGHEVVIRHGERIAQMVISQFAVLGSETVESLEDTDRTGGFGSTGVR